jgi:hypothetical protein
VSHFNIIASDSSGVSDNFASIVQVTAVEEEAKVKQARLPEKQNPLVRFALIRHIAYTCGVYL